MSHLPHLGISREPEFQPKRKKRRPPPPPPIVGNRAAHGARLSTETGHAANALHTARGKIGVNTSQFIVVELSTWDTRVREIFEKKFSAHVVEEFPTETQRNSILVKGQSDQVQRALVSDQPQSLTLPGARVRRANSSDFGKKPTDKKPILDEGSTAKDFTVIELPSLSGQEQIVIEANGFPVLWKGTKKAKPVNILVQFSDSNGMARFHSELAEYRQASATTNALAPGMRNSFFDAIDWCRPRDAGARTGPQLAMLGFHPTQNGCNELDVDLWHPGDRSAALSIRQELRQLCKSTGGATLDDIQTSSLILARVMATKKTLDSLLEWDLVARIELPPRLISGYNKLFTTGRPPQIEMPTADAPMVTVIDSGTIAGHPYLRGWILDEIDFGTSEPDSSDQNGHGTRVSGLAVYGSLTAGLETGHWKPSVTVLSAKVLEHDPIFNETTFPRGKRPEHLIELAIRHFHRERRCRVFNLSIGMKNDLYSTGRRQFPLAEKLDQLARELDVVIVVSAGNVWPAVPNDCRTRIEWQTAVRNQLLCSAEARLINPATASLAITVGSLARSARPSKPEFVAASPEAAPSPFSRVGPGYDTMTASGSVKPDFVAYGGNFALNTSGGVRWHEQEPHLGEPTTIPPISGRFLGSVVGTSFAAPQVAHAAGKAVPILKAALAKEPSANSIRALLGACSELPQCGCDWLLDPKGLETAEKRQMVGYGCVNGVQLEKSLQHDVCLIAEDRVEIDKWHIYSLPLPEDFLKKKGERGLVVSLAYNPPVRSSRKEYLARTMSLDVFRGMSLPKLRARLAVVKDGGDLKLDDLGVLKPRPPKTDLTWSTLQVQRLLWKKSPRFQLCPGDKHCTIRIAVGCHERFTTGEAAIQDYSLALRLWHRDEKVQLHQHLKVSVRARQTVRTTVIATTRGRS